MNLSSYNGKKTKNLKYRGKSPSKNYEGKKSLIIKKKKVHKPKYNKIYNCFNKNIKYRIIFYILNTQKQENKKHKVTSLNQ